MVVTLLKIAIFIVIYCFWIPRKWHEKLGELKAWWEE